MICSASATSRSLPLIAIACDRGKQITRDILARLRIRSAFLDKTLSRRFRTKRKNAQLSRFGLSSLAPQDLLLVDELFRRVATLLSSLAKDRALITNAPADG
jgi:hypothetical protein